MTERQGRKRTIDSPRTKGGNRAKSDSAARRSTGQARYPSSLLSLIAQLRTFLSHEDVRVRREGP